MELFCEHCSRRPFEGVVPSKGDFPEPMRVCGECARNFPFVDRDGFPITHFKSESGHWFFVFIHRDYLYPYFYPSARPDYKYLVWDKALTDKEERKKEVPICPRVLPYRYDPMLEEEIIYFAYGTAIDERQLEKRDVNFSIVGIASLFEVKLDFSKPVVNKTSMGSANLRVGEKDDFVMGLLYRLKSEEDLRKVDIWEEVAGKNTVSRRILVHLLCNGQPVPAVTHVSNVIKNDLRPSRTYKNKMLNALRRHNFPKQWIGKVEAFDHYLSDEELRQRPEVQSTSMNLPAVIPE